MKKAGAAYFPLGVDAEKIQTVALHLLFRKVGDAMKVRMQPARSMTDVHPLWRVDVYGSDA